MPVADLIQSFSSFAQQQVLVRGDSVSIDDLFDEWRIQHPPSDDWLAIRASLDDMANGERGQDVDEFVAEFRLRNGL